MGLPFGPEPAGSVRLAYDDGVTAGNLLTLPELGDLRARSAWRGMGLVVHAWAVIGAAMLLHAAWPRTGSSFRARRPTTGSAPGSAPLMRRALWWAIARDRSGWTAITRVLGWRPPWAGAGRAVPSPPPILAGVLVAAGHWHLDVLLWLLPSAA